MQAWVTTVMEQFGYIGIFLMMALENLFPPIPSEVILPFGGFLTTYTNLSVFGVIVTATTGSVLGAIILYGIGMLMDVTRVEKIVARWGHLIRIKKEDVHKSVTWFENYGYWTVLICRMIPIIRSIISVPAGMARMSFWLFLLLTMIGTVIWNTILIFIGVALGESWDEILRFMQAYSSAVYTMLGAGLVVLVFLFVARKHKK